MKNRNLSAPMLRIAAFATMLSTPLVSFADTATMSGDASTNAAPATAPAQTPAPETAPTPAPAAPVTPTTPPPAAPADTTTTAPGERPTTYTMVAGDTLDSIAHKFDTSIHALAALNHITKAQYKKLRAGKVLQIPPATPAK
jgi:LysM repeat protein